MLIKCDINDKTEPKIINLARNKDSEVLLCYFYQSNLRLIELLWLHIQNPIARKNFHDITFRILQLRLHEEFKYLCQKKESNTS